MEPQGRGNVPARHTPERNKRLGLRKTTLESRVHVQTVGLNAETKKVSAPSRRRRMSLDIPFNRTCPRFGVNQALWSAGSNTSAYSCELTPAITLLWL